MIRGMAGRADETAVVLALAQDAVRGRAGTLLVSGEAGIGKTALLRTACAGLTARILWASCLPMTCLTAPLLPLRAALRGEPDPPALHTVADFDAWLDRLTQQVPTVLVVDDVHWADQSSLDALRYVIAGRADRQLAVAVTLRAADEHRLHRWLADVRRLPGVRELPLGRLDRSATRDQITALLGRSPHECLVDDVLGRSDGNPYLTRLLVGGVAPDADCLPARRPMDLREALARTWHGLSAPAQQLTAAIALAGRPLAGGPAALLREAVEAGVLRAGGDGCHWFSHPLFAEVLADSLLADERRGLHAELAETASDPIERADHYHRAGLVAAAYEWALIAADAAKASGGAAEAHRLLRRALRLRPSDADLSAVELLQHIRRAAERAGRDDDELPAVEELLALLDWRAAPLAAAELLVRRTELQFGLGIEFAGTADAQEAERLSARHPESREHALATAVLAGFKLLHRDRSGIAEADKALRLARACGWPRASGYALIAAAMARVLTGDIAGAHAAALEAQAIGFRTGDFDLVRSATYAVVISVEGPSPRAAITALRRSREQLEEMGAPQSQVSEMCSNEAEILLQVGDWRNCLDRLRVALGARPSALADARSRNTAALLASRQGRHAEAAAHAARAEELIRELSEFRRYPSEAVRAELALAAGDTERAISCALRGLGLEPSPGAELLLPLAARALADRVQACRDRDADPGPELARLLQLRERYPEVVTAATAQAEYHRRRVRAMQELADAETARGRRDPGEVARWRRAADACRAADVPWDEAYCHWREAQSALRYRSTRRQGTAALRRAYQMAVDLAALPLLAQLDLLAKNTHVAPHTAGANRQLGVAQPARRESTRAEPTIHKDRDRHA